MLLLVIDLSDKYKTIHCKSTNENIACNKWYHTYYNSLKNLNQFIYEFTKTFYSIDILPIVVGGAQGGGGNDVP